METVIIVIHLMLVLALVGAVLLQKSEGGALGMGGGNTGFMTARGAGDLLTRTTWILGTIFFVLSLALTMLAGRERGAASVVDRIKVQGIDPNSLNQPPQQQQPAAPTSPSDAPTPLTAPTPQVRNPFGEAPVQQQPAPAAPSNP